MTDDVDPIEVGSEELDAKSNKPSMGAVRRLLPMLLSVVTLVGFASVIWYAYNTGIREGSEFAAPILKPDGLHRQFYVAVTRTIENLYLIQAQDNYYRYVI